ncbi:MAG: hypothetical protein FD155_2790 [Bacteroidetes bacterium]|nr:MAG: hypothetical protein FD155_2790 [Bacteroidota bacterium]
MRGFLFIVFLITAISGAYTQSTDSITNSYKNSAEKMLSTDGKLMLGGYGEVHYNQPLSAETRNNGTLDVHRMVILIGYNFSSKTQFISEIEFEHISEVYIEQAFLQHKINNYINLRAGLMLIPMGIINEYHEPTTFNGVERPLVDNKIAPTTWREVGIGINGNVIEASLKYQLYVVNGFSSFNNIGMLNGKNGFRNGRQKGAESYISSPNLSGKVEYYGFRGLNIGFSGYFGKTQSTLVNGIDKEDDSAVAKADSSITGISMLGLDARYNLGGLQLRGQFYYTSISNTLQYNNFTAQNGKQNDLGSAMMGYYIEAGYNVLKLNQTKAELIPFIRFENYDTHFATEGLLQKNKAYNNQAITTGLTYKLTKGAVIKADMQFIKSAAASEYSKIFNAGVGVMF